MTTATDQPVSALRFSHSDRRGHKRFEVARPGKAFRRATQQYTPVFTLNLSVGGALLDVHTQRPLQTGELIDVAITFRDRPLLRSDSLVRAIVTRAQPVADGRQTVAVRYLRPESAIAA